MTSERPDWNTPDEVVALVHEMGNLGLDPCSNLNSIVAAPVEWYGFPHIDGLAQPWFLFGLVYVNPPYGREIVKWVEKMVGESEMGAEIIALVPARTDARWWQDYATKADAVCFWRGRLRFLGGENSAPFPSAVLYWGPRADRFKSVFGVRGWVV